MYNFERAQISELMDDPSIDHLSHLQALHGLSRLNQFSRAEDSFWTPIESLSRQLGRPVKVLDIASGGADNLIRLAQRAKKYGVEIDLYGSDLSENALQHARQKSEEAGVPIEFFQLDALDGAIPGEFDVVTNSLFFHHLREAQAVDLLRRMKTAARHLIVVDDLVRSPANYVLVTMASRVLTRSHVVHFDAPASVRNAYTRSELEEIASAADLAGAQVLNRFPCRMTLRWYRRLGEFR